MRLKRTMLHPMTSRIYRNLIYVTILLAPVLIRGACARNDNLRGQEPCSICSGEGKVGYPNVTIPYFFLHGDDSVTCSDLDAEASTVPADSNLCAKYRANAGYCGCPGAAPVDACSFCPKGDLPSKSEMILPTGDTCKNLYTYVSFLGEDQCSSLQYEAIAKNAYDCGCEISMPKVLRAYATQQRLDGCTLCPDGSPVPQRNYFLEKADMTCGDYSDFISGLDREECEFQTNRGTHELFAYQCNCPGTEPPVCLLRENPQLCTVSLLDSVDNDEQCECYSFCDGEFVGCENYPGKFLGDQCPGIGISGCNYPGAIDYDGGGDEPETCSLCPDSTNNIANPDAILPPFDGMTIPGSKGRPSTCRDLIDYLTTQSSEHRDCQVAKSRLAYYCGCKNVEPNCTLCPGGVEPFYKDKIVTDGTTCADFANTVLTWESTTCELGASYLSVIAPRCGCISTDFPMCPVQRNPRMCTINRIRSAGENCECYNFCGDQFHSCADYPGKVLDESQCPEGVPAVSGCNKELATSQRCILGSIGPGCGDAERERRGKTSMRHLRH